MIRALPAFLALPTLVAGFIPWGLSLLPGPHLIGSAVGLRPIACGALILVASVVSFYRRGRGTLAPWDPPKHLVVQDLYRFNRNPMYVGVVLIVLGWALWTGRAWNYAWAVFVPIAFHLRVVLYEEREMERTFADGWARYKAAVPRWGVRLRAFRS